MQTAIRCLFMRGGTSRGPFFNAADLPHDIPTRDRVLVAVMGSPDRRQINGLGGAHQGHDQGHAGLGEHPRGLRRCARQPGDVVIADADGVIVVPAAVAQQTADAAEKREANGVEKRAQLAAGVLGLDMYRMREPLQKAGLRYID